TILVTFIGALAGFDIGLVAGAFIGGLIGWWSESKDTRERLDLFVKIISAAATISLFVVGSQINNTIRESQDRRAQDDARDKAYVAYLDGISDLLIAKKLGPILIATQDVTYQNDVAEALHARTQALLDTLDCERRVKLVRFLVESNFLFQSSPYARALESANLTKCNLKGM